MSEAMRPILLVLTATLVAVVASASLPAQPARGRNHGRATEGLDCGGCHTPASWKMAETFRGAAGFDHDRTGFPLRGGHRAAACTQCHDGRGAVQRACASCHVDAHGGKNGKQCDRCHVASSFTSVDAFAIHSHTRLPLSGMHVLVDCADCHRRSAGDRYGGVPAQCFACHEQDYRRPGLHPVHDGSRGDPPFPRDCQSCHRTDAFAPAVVDAARFAGTQAQALMRDPRAHDRQFVLSRGPHRGAACASCHVNLGQPRATRCSSCHGSTQLAAQHPSTGAPPDGSCLSCHAGGFAR
ncbi:MAG: hypothetical protein ABW252_17530 [Polyangiales bacterium]